MKINKNGWFGKSKNEWQADHDRECIKAYGKKSSDMAKPMPYLTDKEFKALQDKARLYR